MFSQNNKRRIHPDHGLHGSNKQL